MSVGSLRDVHRFVYIDPGRYLVLAVSASNKGTGQDQYKNRSVPVPRAAEPQQIPGQEDVTTLSLT